MRLAGKTVHTSMWPTRRSEVSAQNGAHTMWPTRRSEVSGQNGAHTMWPTRRSEVSGQNGSHVNVADKKTIY